MLPFSCLIVPLPSSAASAALVVPAVPARMICLCGRLALVVHVLAHLVRRLLDGLHVSLILCGQSCHPCADRRGLQNEKTGVGPDVHELRFQAIGLHFQVQDDVDRDERERRPSFPCRMVGRHLGLSP